MTRFARLVLCWLLTLGADGIAAQSNHTVIASDPSCPSCDDVVRRVMPLLPRTPARVVVIDTLHTPKVLRDTLHDVEGFVTQGDPAVYLTRQGSTFTHALNGPGIWDRALAIIVWHEMAHLDGADEREARSREEGLWLFFVQSGEVDATRGMAYLALLRKRPPP